MVDLKSVKWQSVAVSGDGNLLLVVGAEYGLFRSTDRGVSWVCVYVDTNAHTKWGQVAMTFDGTLLLVVSESFTLVSYDAGDQWHKYIHPWTPPNRKFGPVSVSWRLANIILPIELNGSSNGSPVTLQVAGYAPTERVWVLFAAELTRTDRTDRNTGSGGVWGGSLWGGSVRPLNWQPDYGTETDNGLSTAFDLTVGATNVEISNQVEPSNSRTYCVEHLHGIVSRSGLFCVDAQCARPPGDPRDVIGGSDCTSRMQWKVDCCQSTASMRACSSVALKDRHTIAKQGCFLEYTGTCTTDDQCFDGQYCDKPSRDNAGECKSQCMVGTPVYRVYPYTPQQGTTQLLPVQAGRDMPGATNKRWKLHVRGGQSVDNVVQAVQNLDPFLPKYTNKNTFIQNWAVGKGCYVVFNGNSASVTDSVSGVGGGVWQKVYGSQKETQTGEWPKNVTSMQCYCGNAPPTFQPSFMQAKSRQLDLEHTHTLHDTHTHWDNSITTNDKRVTLHQETALLQRTATAISMKPSRVTISIGQKCVKSAN
eukprot:GDKI01032413.1.p1 GENE.GDKI01032413.1~~GDKI01032413.1.p1  ORF type:complete len:534 (-),score=125.98 GDKI01032413.1:235-1836(-)